nr:lactosylceramide 4-alpha-galactosyltransferase-like [Ipomoea batatas]
MFFCARISMKMFHTFRINRTKFHIFSSTTLAAIVFLIILSDNAFINHSSIRSTQFRSQKHPRLKPLNSIKEDVIEQVHEDLASLVPPFNVTAEERTEWFKRNFPEFGIFKSDEVSRRFDGRVREFYRSRECKVRFFMTWIASANSFGRREFLSLESLFKAHKDGCLIIISQTMDSEYGNRVLEPLIRFGVLAVKPDLEFLFKNTPAEDWYDDLRSGKKDPGEIPLAQNLSNLIRLAVLYKYGGVYLDTDFIVLKDFSGLRNSIGAQSINLSGNWSRLNNAVLVFDKGHPLLLKFLEEFSATFDGNKWGHNGPYLVSRVVEKVSSGSAVSFNFTVLPPMAFYPADWTRIAGFFRHPRDRRHGRWIEAKMVQLRGESYGVHLWNRESGRMRIEEGSIIGSIFSGHCIICKGIYDS